MLLEEFEDTKRVIRIEFINQRRTDNTMANRKRTKRQKDKQRSTKHLIKIE